ncbi:MAG: Mannose-P-dolichol utilization defect 1 protein [Caeruleum heppii]|nr:MAG: Mannose-P-dolichol utilization defect 1 protein [Caeruleum heppii]
MDTLRTTLLPITQNLPTPLDNLAVTLLGPNCHQSLLHDLDLSNTACLKLALSKALGLGIITASSIVKLPQIFKLLSSRSPSGISTLAYGLETLSYVVTLSYNLRKGFPFSTYGETALIAAQNVVIALLVFRFQGREALAAAFVAVLAGVAGVLGVEGVVPEKELGWAQGAAGLLGVASKVPQIVTVWREGGTGQLSAFAVGLLLSLLSHHPPSSPSRAHRETYTNVRYQRQVFNYLLGSLTRIFTTLQEVDDPLILYGFIAGFVLNAVLAAQMLYYWNAPASNTAAGAKGKGRRANQKMGLEGKADERGGSAVGQGAFSSGLVTPGGKGKGPSTRRRG